MKTIIEMGLLPVIYFILSLNVELHIVLVIINRHSYIPRESYNTLSGGGMLYITVVI